MGYKLTCRESLKQVNRGQKHRTENKNKTFISGTKKKQQNRSTNSRVNLIIHCNQSNSSHIHESNETQVVFGGERNLGVDPT